MGDLFSVLGAANDDRWNHMDGWVQVGCGCGASR
jgi:hypothetical protein